MLFASERAPSLLDKRTAATVDGLCSVAGEGPSAQNGAGAARRDRRLRVVDRCRRRILRPVPGHGPTPPRDRRVGRSRSPRNLAVAGVTGTHRRTPTPPRPVRTRPPPRTSRTSVRMAFSCRGIVACPPAAVGDVEHGDILADEHPHPRLVGVRPPAMIGPRQRIWNQIRYLLMPFATKVPHYYDNLPPQ